MIIVYFSEKNMSMNVGRNFAVVYSVVYSMVVPRIYENWYFYMLFRKTSSGFPKY